MVAIGDGDEGNSVIDNDNGEEEKEQKEEEKGRMRARMIILCIASISMDIKQKYVVKYHRPKPKANLMYLWGEH